MGSEVKSSIYPVYTKGTAVYSDDPRDYICYVCPEKQTEPLGQHLKDENHLTRFASFSQSIVHMASGVYNKMAPKSIDFGRIVASSLTDFVPEGAPEFLFKNYISKRGIQYFCHLCKVKLPFWFVVESHIRDSKHQALRNERIDESFLQNLSCPSLYYERAVNNSIFMKTEHSMFCYLCEIDLLPSERGIRGHIRMKCHVEQLLEHFSAALKLARVYRGPDDSPGLRNSGNFLYKVEGLSNDDNNNSTSENQETKDMTSYPELNSPVVDGKRMKRVSFCTENNRVIDTGDDADLIGAHEDGGIQLESPQVHEDDEILGENNEDLTSGDVNNVIRSDEEGNQVPKGVVEAAKIGVPSPKVLDTIEQIPKVPQILPEVITQGEDNRYTCSVCKCLLPDLVSVEQHLKGSKHLRNASNPLLKGIVHPNDTSKNASPLPRGMIRLPDTSKTAEPLPKEIIHPHDTSKNTQPLPKEIIKDQDNKYTCSLCGLHDMPDLVAVNRHLNGSRHLRNALLLPEEIILGQDNKFTCSLCRRHDMPDLVTVKRHLNGPRHLRNALLLAEGPIPLHDTSENDPPLPRETIHPRDTSKNAPPLPRGMIRLPNTLKNAELLPKEIIQGQDGKYTCSLCKCHDMTKLVTVKQHLNGVKHLRNTRLLAQGIIPPLDTPKNFPPLPRGMIRLPKWKNAGPLPKEIVQGQDGKYTCSLCGCHDMTKLVTVKQHLKGARHLRNALLLPEGIISLDDSGLMCLLCQCRINGEGNIRHHVLGAEHQEAKILQHQRIEAMESRER